MLGQLAETIYEKRERVLIFTQFRELTGALDDYLASVFRLRGGVIHGGVPVKERNAIVERFQSDAYMPYLVVSLRVGGTGLNLTRANHVIHFDRWWNPSVENQATDRAFRIGQQRMSFWGGTLFPAPREISLQCSCPDWAIMCKHVAAALYGVAARLDEDPMLFFSLRGIDTGRFVDVVIANRIERMLSNVNKPSSRIIQDAELGELFGAL